MGANTTNSYFYKPSLGASGAAELALFDAALDATDLVIKSNVDGLAGKQPLDAGLTSIAGLTYVSASFIKLTANDTYAVRTLAQTLTDIGGAASGGNSDITALTGLTTALGAAYGGTGVLNNAASTLTITGNFATTLTVTEATGVTLPASGTLLANLLEDTTPELGGEMDCGAHSIGFTIQTATGDGTTTIDWRLGNKFKFTFGAQNDTLTFTAPTNPCTLMLTIIQDATGSRTITWPATVKWPAGTAPTLTTTANARDKVALDWDGAQYDGVCTKAFS